MHKRQSQPFCSTGLEEGRDAAALIKGPLLIVDTNISWTSRWVIWRGLGDLARPMFSLDYQFGVPDILFYQELTDCHDYLREMGLQIHSLSGASMQRVDALTKIYPRAGSNDLCALVLAEVKQCRLLTGDAHLRKAAEQENVKINGTIWLMREMLVKQRISVVDARAAWNKMDDSGRRLPRVDMEKVFLDFELNLNISE